MCLQDCNCLVYLLNKLLLYRYLIYVVMLYSQYSLFLDNLNIYMQLKQLMFLNYNFVNKNIFNRNFEFMIPDAPELITNFLYRKTCLANVMFFMMMPVPTLKSLFPPP